MIANKGFGLLHRGQFHGVGSAGNTFPFLLDFRDDPLVPGTALLSSVQRLCDTVEDLTMRLNDRLPPQPVPAHAPVPESTQHQALSTAKLGVAVRRQREKLLGRDLFSEPMWDILLELFIAQCENIDVTIGNACLAASVPMTSALRYCQTLLDRELVFRERDPRDRRRVFLRLSEQTFANLTKLLGEGLAAAPAGSRIAAVAPPAEQFAPLCPPR